MLYLPSAATLTAGGYFTKRPGSEQYDTIVSAQQLLKAMYDAHQEQLAALPQRLNLRIASASARCAPAAWWQLPGRAQPTAPVAPMCTASERLECLAPR